DGRDEHEPQAKRAVQRVKLKRRLKSLRNRVRPGRKETRPVIMWAASPGAEASFDPLPDRLASFDRERTTVTREEHALPPARGGLTIEKVCKRWQQPAVREPALDQFARQYRNDQSDYERQRAVDTDPFRAPRMLDQPLPVVACLTGGQNQEA